MSRKKEDKSPDPGLGTILGVGAAVVAGAALMYGAKKLFDFFDRPAEGAVGGVPAEPSTAQPVKNHNQDKYNSDSDDDYESRNNTRDQRRTSNEPSFSENRVREFSDRMNDYSSELRDQRFSTNVCEPFAGARPKTSGLLAPQSSKRSLSSELLEYYHNYVMIPRVKISASKSIVDKITALLTSRLPTSILESVFTYMPVVQEVMKVGSAWDDLQVIICNEFDFHIIIEMKDHNLQIDSTGSGKWRIVQKRQDLTNLNCVILSSKLVDSLKSVCSEILKDIDIPVIIEVLCLGPSLQLVVRYVDDSTLTNSKLFINLRPAIKHEEMCLVPADSLNHSTPGNDEQEWREYHGEQESRLINRYGPLIDTHRAILKIFKAIRLNFPKEFGILSSYHYKTVLFRLLDDQPEENEWCDSVLSERFIDFLIELGSCCKEKLLPNFFETDVNLLDNISPDSLQSLSQFVNKILGRNDFSCLFEERNYGRIISGE